MGQFTIDSLLKLISVMEALILLMIHIFNMCSQVSKSYKCKSIWFDVKGKSALLEWR